MSMLHSDNYSSTVVLSIPFSSMMVTLLVIVLAPFVVLATRVVANPLLSSAPISLSITKQINSNGKYNPVLSDRSRVEGLNRLGSPPSNDTFYRLPLDNTVANYVAYIGVGNPPSNCKSCRLNVLSHGLLYDAHFRRPYR